MLGTSPIGFLFGFPSYSQRAPCGNGNSFCVIQQNGVIKSPCCLVLGGEFGQIGRYTLSALVPSVLVLVTCGGCSNDASPVTIAAALAIGTSLRNV